MRKPLIAGNWKMYKTPEESVAFVTDLIGHLGNRDDREVLVCPPFTSLPRVAPLCASSPVALGAQNCATEEDGAYTGEISAGMLKHIPVQYVICGHSERRNIFGETDAVVNRKVVRVTENGMCPILCVGEKLEEREANRTFQVVDTQLTGSLKNVHPEGRTLVIAYEPVWAIGTGRNATPPQAEEVHVFIREWLKKNCSPVAAEEIRILYGGSVKPDNIDSLMAMRNIDGALVGGASLKTDSFLRIIAYV